MNGDNLKGTVLPVAGILVFLTALGVSIFTQPLKDSRPYVTEVHDPFEKVRARLWQDPFRAVLDHVKAVLDHLKEVGLKPGDSNRICVLDDVGKSQAGADGYVKAQIDERRKTGAVTVLGAMVSAAPYAEDTETRIRYRYAILSGLRRLGFSPEDAEHIDFVTLQYGNNPDLSKDVTLSNIMPFEWLNNKTGDSVLLLWINDDLFQEEPFSRLAGLSAYIGFKDKERVKDRKDLKFKIIGPAGSTTLLGMHQEMKKANREKKTSLLAALSGVEIYSATATVDASTAIQEEGDPLSPSPKKDAEDIFEKEFHNFSPEIIFKRTTPSDLKLAQMLVDELGLRDLDLLLKQEKNDRIHNHKDLKDPYGGHRDHVVLIAEWDTVYGQSLPETFERALKEKHNENFNPKAKQYVKEVKDITWVHRFSYLRGLDGILPGEPGKKDEKQDKENSAPGDIKKLEQPTGKSQYDYLRRLAESIYSFDQDLQAKKHGSIKAIGVLGNDFYDKYLVLQALRQRFPGLIFFTTDLDARLLHPDYIKWTRNLVVASNFGLSLRRDIQGDVPPFRDNYSTSMFLATLWAFGKERDSVLIEEEMKKPPEPRIFEVGRHTAVDLRPANSPPAGEVHPVPYEAGTIGKTSGQIAVIAILLLFFLCFLSNRVREGVKRIGFAGKKHPKKAMILLFLLILVIVCFYVRVLRNPDEEPFSIFEGVSIWPTEIIRIIGVLLALQFWVKSRRILRENSRKLGKEFQFKGCPGCEDSGEVGEKAKGQGAGQGRQRSEEGQKIFRENEI